MVLKMLTDKLMQRSSTLIAPGGIAPGSATTATWCFGTSKLVS